LGSHLALPGLIDAHVHLREPGATQKEDCSSGTRAALAGGFSTILDMPNNLPPLTDVATLNNKQTIFHAKAFCDYGIFAGYNPLHLAALISMAPHVVGLKLYLDQTFNGVPISATELEDAFRTWPGPGPIAIHAESHSIPFALELAQRYQQRLHVCHVPHPDDLLIIDSARQRGVQVTCEVTPHHLLLTTEDAPRLGAYGQMKQPLLSPDLVELIWQRLYLVDILTSDHAPHTRQEKEGFNPPPGVPGLETTLPLLLNAVDQGKLTLERFLEMAHNQPARIYGISSDTGEVEVEIDKPYVLPETGYVTRCGWSPFAGKQALGRVHQVVLRNTVVWQDGALLVNAGFGRDVKEVGLVA
jgi:dihydroorotase-like cyclic amidohydrolase